eukprot:GHVS01002407.1.p1 GENE.GHVS01002407.1~~GHVS01002407.1.p1  ORF type:complete len:123 (-),score=23.14 GHVS01002407.1:479-847(-)
MKTFRMIVLAVIAAIAIGGLTVDAFCSEDGDCNENVKCMLEGEIFGVKYAEDEWGFCNDLVEASASLKECSELEDFIERLEVFLGLSADERKAGLEEIKGVFLDVKEIIVGKVADFVAANED